MKKKLLYTLALLTTFATFSCSDKDEASYDESSDRLMTPVFRTNRTMSKGQTDPYLCQVIGRNTMQLYWSQVKGAKGYQIKASYEQGVATGDLTKWEDPTMLALDTIIYGEEQDQMLLKDLLFSKTYRFAIRALSDRGEAHHSNWFGTGNLHQWTDMVYYDMEDKYKVPSIISQKANITKESFDLYLDRSYAKSGNKTYTQEELDDFNEYYTLKTDASGKKVWNVSNLVIEPASSNPDAKVPAEYQYPGIKLDDSMFNADGIAQLSISGLDSNSVYNMYTYDGVVMQEKAKEGLNVQQALNYAQHNLDITVRTKGDPGDPIIIEPMPQDTMHYTSGDQIKSISLPIPATSIQPLLEEFMKSNEYAENKVFYLRGGEAYFLRGGLELYKGLKIATKPEDLAEKGRAKVFLYHPQILDVSGGSSPSPAFFMLSRNPIGSENPMITIDIDKFELENLDFCVPYARNFGDPSGSKIHTNNYFMNMYSSGMGSVVEKISLKDCSFQGIIGGFYRVQANYGVRIKNFELDNIDFYNGGYFAASGRRYNWFHANPEKNININIWENFVMKNCTIYDNPLGYMFNHNNQKKSIEWPADLHYNITLLNNTFINLNTCNAGNSMIFNLNYIPGGSTFTVKNNLFVLTRNEDDTERTMVQKGCDIRTINGSGTVKLDFEDNYSTNDNLKDGQIWSDPASAFDYTKKNTFGAMQSSYEVSWGKAGFDGLTVKVADISAKDLMVQPNPPHKFVSATPNHYDHVSDGIDGTVTNIDKDIRPDYQPGMVDLHFKNFDNVLVEKGIGAPKWRQK